jgi:hypothetical protein
MSPQPSLAHVGCPKSPDRLLCLSCCSHHASWISSRCDRSLPCPAECWLGTSPIPGWGKLRPDREAPSATLATRAEVRAGPRHLELIGPPRRPTGRCQAKRQPNTPVRPQVRGCRPRFSLEEWILSVETHRTYDTRRRSVTARGIRFSNPVDAS